MGASRDAERDDRGRKRRLSTGNQGGRPAEFRDAWDVADTILRSMEYERFAGAIFGVGAGSVWLSAAYALVWSVLNFLD
jgi:hypothetical protein